MTPTVIILIVGAVILVILAGWGSLLQTVIRSDPEEKRQWDRASPYIALGSGTLAFVSSWFTHTDGVIRWAMIIGSGTFLVAYSTHLLLQWRRRHNKLTSPESDYR